MLPLPSFIPLLGPIGISGFALAGIAGVLAGRLLTRHLARGGAGAVREAAEDALTPVLLGLLIGGRLGNQLWTQDLVWNGPLTWLKVTGTSLSFAGGLLGACAGLLWALRGRDDRLALSLAVADVFAPGAALAVAIGWVGVPVLGRVSSLPWALPVAAGAGVQPVQVYGLLGFGAVAAWLTWQVNHLDYPGQNLVTFVVLLSAFRFVLGFSEQAPLWLGPWSPTQVADAGLAVAGLALGVWLRRLVPSGGPGTAMGAKPS